MSYRTSAEEYAILANGRKLDRVIQLLEQLVQNQTDAAHGAMPGYERVYNYTGPDGGTVTYPDNKPHYRKIGV